MTATPLILLTSPPWAAQAACRDFTDDTFYPAESDDDAIDVAKSICARCPVRSACLAAGIGERFGIWGGTTEAERRGSSDDTDEPLAPYNACGTPSGPKAHRRRDEPVCEQCRIAANQYNREQRLRSKAKDAA